MRHIVTVVLAVCLVVLVLASIGKAARRGGGPSEADVQKITEACPAKAPATPAKPRKLLVWGVCTGFRHGAVPYGAKALEIMGKKTGAFEAVVTEDMSMFEPEKLKEFDAVCMNNTTGELFMPRRTSIEKLPAAERQKVKRLRQSLLDFVKGGKGLIGIHGATDCSYKWKEYGEMMGGYFTGHPWGAGTSVTFKVDDPDHPINAAFGGKGFTTKDEIYQFARGVYSRERLRVLLSLDMTKTAKRGKRKDQDYAVSWVQSYGKGRVFYCSLGHNNHIFWHPLVLRHYLAGIQFAMGDLKGDTTPNPLSQASGAGWKVLFDGKDLSAWQSAGGGRPGAGWVIENGAVVRKGRGGDIWTKERFGDFILDLETRAKGNSGVFIRTDNIRDCVQTGIEVAVDRSFGKKKLGTHDFMAIYDCLAPTKNAMKPPGQWNRAVITCNDNMITIVLNGEKVIDMDLNKWSEPRKNPDGSRNKFRTALKDFKREGHIGLQDHGGEVHYRNIRIKPLKATK